MNRRDFFSAFGRSALSTVAISGRDASAFAAVPETTYPFKTKHLIWIINGGGSRKQDWQVETRDSAGYGRLIREGFTFTEDHNETVTDHEHCSRELLTGNSHSVSPTLLSHIRAAHQDRAVNYWFIKSVNGYRHWKHPEAVRWMSPVSITTQQVYSAMFTATPSHAIASEFAGIDLSHRERCDLEAFAAETCRARAWEIGLKGDAAPGDPSLGDAMSFSLVPDILRYFKPKVIVVHQVGHDVAHRSLGYLDYLDVHRTTDRQIARIVEFVKSDPYFSRNTSIVVRPEFGRDDEPNIYGELHHSLGFYQCHRSASIWWGPDFRQGSTNRVVDRRDMVPTICRIFNTQAPHAQGRVREEMFGLTLTKTVSSGSIYRSTPAGALSL